MLLGVVAAWHLALVVFGAIGAWGAMSARYRVDRFVRRRARRDARTQRARAHQAEDALAEIRRENTAVWQAFDAAAPQAARDLLARLSLDGDTA